ncbi:MAG: FAD-binding oxidoreductase [Dehalococcoidales bacterium]|nr:FAD-binding oxidoreductase [Dehalococcoidales bacterium]
MSAEEIALESDAAEQLARGLPGLLGAGRVETEPAVLAAHTLDGLTPKAVVSPKSLAEAVEVVRWAGQNKRALTPWGGGTKREIGRPLERLDIVLKTGGFASILEIDEGNLTAEVEGGLSLGTFEAELAARRLYFAIDPLEGGRATIGGTVVANANGPRRLLHRTVRDHVLGLHVILPSGEMLHTGGKTVKDVAGYNLTRPFIGSWGTLGVVGQATLRLLPVPEDSATVVAWFPTSDAAVTAALRVRGSELLPSALEICSGPALQTAIEGNRVSLDNNSAWLLAGLEGHQEPVRRMVGQIDRVMGEGGAVDVDTLAGAEAKKVWDARRRLSDTVLGAPGTNARAKVSVPITSLGPLLAAAKSIANGHGLQLAYAVHAGNSVGHLFLQGGESAAADICAALTKLREAAATMSGFLMLEVAPLEVKRAFEALPPRDDYALMACIRASLDPAGIMNPGKLV